MPMKTFQKTMPRTTNITAATDAEPGSDKYMTQRGYHPASEAEREHSGKFVNREGVFSIARGIIRRLTRTSSSNRVQVFASRTEGSTFPHDRQRAEQSNTRRNVAVVTAVFQEESGQWQIARWGEPEPKY